jgi:transposase
MADKTYSTLQAAKKAGVHRATLIRWIQAGKVTASKEMLMPGGNTLRWWTDSDIEKLKAHKAEHYWEMPEAERGKK